MISCYGAIQFQTAVKSVYFDVTEVWNVSRDV